MGLIIKCHTCGLEAERDEWARAVADLFVYLHPTDINDRPQEAQLYICKKCGTVRVVEYWIEN